MKINWSAGFWMVWDMKTGNRLAKVRQLHIRVPCQLHSEKESSKTGDWYGWAIVAGQLRVEGAVGFIE